MENIENVENVEKKKITPEQLLEKKLEVDANKEKEYYSEELGGLLVFNRIRPDKVSDLIGQLVAGGSQYAVFQQLIYESCPLFKNKELILKCGVAEPFEVVNKVLNSNIAEVYEIGNMLLGWYGFKLDIKKQ